MALLHAHSHASLPTNLMVMGNARPTRPCLSTGFLDGAPLCRDCAPSMLCGGMLWHEAACALCSFNHLERISTSAPQRPPVIPCASLFSPEVYRGEPYNDKADVFSFGIVLLELSARVMLCFTGVWQELGGAGRGEGGTLVAVQGS